MIVYGNAYVYVRSILTSDSLSKCMNRTVNQCLCYYVQCNQKGWVHALPKIHFDIMNTVNQSTGIASFILHLGCLPCIIPPLIPTSLLDEPMPEDERARDLIEALELITVEAQDSLLMSKISQMHAANTHRSPEEPLVIGHLVMLSTLHCHREYATKGNKRMAKFFPRFDRLYHILKCFPDFSTYKLDLPAHTNIHPVFHISQLRKYHANDQHLFPEHEPQPLGLIVTPDRLEEFFVDKIIDACQHSRGWHFLVCWMGYSPEHNSWLAASTLDRWYDEGGDGPGQ
jgi:hypothetical protein